MKKKEQGICQILFENYFGEFLKTALGDKDPELDRCIYLFQQIQSWPRISQRWSVIWPDFHFNTNKNIAVVHDLVHSHGRWTEINFLCDSVNFNWRFEGALSVQKIYSEIVRRAEKNTLELNNQAKIVLLNRVSQFLNKIWCC